MGTYGISFIGDDELVAGQDFLFVDLHGDDAAWIFYRESALSPVSLEDSWTAYRALLDDGELDPGHRADLREAQAPIPEPRHLRAI